MGFRDSILYTSLSHHPTSYSSVLPPSPRPPKPLTLSTSLTLPLCGLDESADFFLLYYTNMDPYIQVMISTRVTEYEREFDE